MSDPVTRLTEWTCPFCRCCGVVKVTQHARTVHVETSGLIFTRGEGRVHGKTTVEVSHESHAPPPVLPTIYSRDGGVHRWTCEGGAPPAGFEMP